MFVGMKMINLERLQQATKRDGANTILEAIKKKLKKAAFSMSSTSIFIIKSNQSPMPVETPILAPPYIFL